MHLLIVSHTEHYATADGVVGWGSTVREISHLARGFDRITHLAPLHPGPPPAAALPYTAPNVEHRPLRPTGGPRVRDKLGALRAAPRFWRAFTEARRGADVVHVRAPANLAALAIVRLLAARDRPPTWVKYAGNWRPEPGTDFRSFRAQRRLLQAPRHRLAVTVNGRWPDQPPHVHTFDNPSFDRAELDAARRAAAGKALRPGEPIRLLFVGGLSTAKGADRVVSIYEQAARRLVPSQAAAHLTLDLVGDGPLRAALEARAATNPRIVLHGWQPRQVVAEHFARAHLVLLPSRSEGWPKVLSEAMAHGAVPLASDVSGIAATLGEAATGATFGAEDIDGFAGAVVAYAGDRERWRRESERAVRAADAFGFDAYYDAVRRLFADSFGIDLPRGRG